MPIRPGTVTRLQGNTSNPAVSARPSITNSAFALVGSEHHERAHSTIHGQSMPYPHSFQVLAAAMLHFGHRRAVLASHETTVRGICRYGSLLSQELEAQSQNMDLKMKPESQAARNTRSLVSYALDDSSRNLPNPSSTNLCHALCVKSTSPGPLPRCKRQPLLPPWLRSIDDAEEMCER